MKKFILIAFLLLVAFVMVGFTLPKRVHVERSITIECPPAMLFTILNSYQYFNDWSPWVARDPNADYRVSGPLTGVGARLSWRGDPQLVGSGWQQIIASHPYDQIDIRLDFDSQGIATTHYYFQTDSTGTRIRQAFDADVTEGLNFFQGFLARYFGLLFDRWIGGDFEQGLQNLKQFAESLPVTDFSSLEIGPVNLVAQNILFVTTSSSQEPADIATAMAAAYAQISSFMHTAGIHMSSQPMAITRAREEGSYRFDAAIPVAATPTRLTGDIQAGKSPAGAAIRAIHHGSHEEMMPTYEKLAAYMSAHGLQQGRVSWEQYVSDPAETAEADLVTYVYIMLEDNGPEEAGAQNNGAGDYQRESQ